MLTATGRTTTSINVVSIGIDYTPAYEQGGGIGRYVRELVQALALQDSQTDYRLFVAGAEAAQLPASPADNFHWTPTRLPTMWLARIWHRARLPYPVERFTGDLGIFHATDFVLPPTYPSTKTILTVHDLSFVRTPETAAPRLRRYLNRVVPRSIARADHVLADSAATKRDIIDLYGTFPEKITVLLSGVNRGRFSPVEDKWTLLATQRKYGIDPDTPYVFSIGTVQPRKNYSMLVRAVAKLRARDICVNLVIAGGRGWLEDDFYQTIERLNAHNYVRMIGFADDDDLAALYSAAACTAFVSLYEGFGFPVLESMACGTPVVTSNVSSLPEVAGDVAPIVDPYEIDQTVSVLQQVLSDGGYAKKLRQRGLGHVHNFTWEQAALNLQAVYRQILEA
ncbi:MAG: glycosyltransferase family 1 protein [Chloroflexota bacterium]